MVGLRDFVVFEVDCDCVSGLRVLLMNWFAGYLVVLIFR